MNEQIETRATEKPDWFEMSEPEKARHQYWACGGQDRRVKRWWQRKARLAFDPSEYYRAVYHSKEDAAAHAATKSLVWEWDGKDPSPCTLPDVMAKARRNGNGGVLVSGFVNGQWQDLAVYRADEPLQGEDL